MPISLSTLFSIFSECLAMVKNQTGRKLKCLRTDNGGEFKSEDFVKFCREHSIWREYTAPHSPEQNGIAERMNPTIQERVVSMLQHSRLSDGFWVEALLTAVHIINMSPSRPLGLKIPQETWTSNKPNYDKLSYWKPTAGNSNQDQGNAFSLCMDPTARSDTNSGTPSTEKSSEVWTSCSTSRLCIKLPKGLLKSEG